MERLESDDRKEQLCPYVAVGQAVSDLCGVYPSGYPVYPRNRIWREAGVDASVVLEDGVSVSQSPVALADFVEHPALCSSWNFAGHQPWPVGKGNGFERLRAIPVHRTVPAGVPAWPV